MTTGRCRNEACSNARSATPIELYPGPGEFCPACGESLEPVPPAAPAPPAPFGGLTALEALAQFDAGAPPPEPPPVRSPGRKRVAVAAASVAAAALIAVALLRPTAAQRPATSDAIRVCRSSLTERFARDVVRAYAESTGVPPARFDVTRSGPCDVRFAAARAAKNAHVVGHDGIVLVVNPQNPLTRLTEDDVRLIFSGAITDWAEFGEPPGRIVPILPTDTSDEALTLARSLLPRAAIGRGVRRVASSADAVKAVVSAGGRGTIALVAFSAAVPAKVLALAPLPAPSLLSIGDGRYALSVAVTVDAAARGATAAGLVRFAQSDDAQAIVLRDGFVPKKGI